jgi:hypothetical protein
MALREVTAGTTQARLRLIKSVTHGCNSSKATLALFLDIERAFDKLWITDVILDILQQQQQQFQLTSHNYNTIILITNPLQQFMERRKF